MLDLLFTRNSYNFDSLTLRQKFLINPELISNAYPHTEDCNLLI